MRGCERLRGTWLFLLLFLSLPAFAISDIAVYRNWDGVAVPNGGSAAFSDPIAAGAADSRLFRIANTGNTNLNLTNATTIVSGTCFSQIETPVTPIAPGASSYVRVRLQCATGGTKTGTLTIRSDDPDENPYTINLSGTVLPPPAPEISVFRDWDGGAIPMNGTVSFASPIAAGAADSLRFRITNSGNASLSLTNATTLVSGTCYSQIETPVTPVAPGASSYVRVRLQCAAGGTYTGTVTIANDDADENPYRFYVSGTVLPPPAPEISVFREWDGGGVPMNGTVAFANSIPAGTPDSLRFRITNGGNANLDLTNATTLVSGTCFSQIETPLTPVAPGGSSYVRVRLQCATPGSYTGTVTISNNDADENPYRFYVSGNVISATPPEISVTRAWDNVAVASGGSFAFPDPVRANAVDSRLFRITNSGTGPLTIANPTALVSGTCFSLVEQPTATVAANGGTTQFRVRLQCATPGTYTGTVSIQNNDADENPYTINLSGTVVANGATYVSQVFPASMNANQFYDVSVTMRNSGTTTWTAAKNYRLGIRPDTASSQWRFDGRLYLAAGDSIAPGASKTFTARLQAPATAGTYQLQWQMVEELVEWFGGISPLTTVTVGAPRNDAAFVSQSVPATMNAGQKYTVSVTMKNTGGTTWSEATHHRLGNQIAGDPFTHRRLLPTGVTVAPNAQYTFSWQVTAPATAGTYTFQWRMVEELVEWFGAFTPSTPVTVRIATPPVVDEITPGTVRSGTITNVTVTGQRLSGSAVTFGALDGVPSPAATLLSISADGTSMSVRVDATNAAVDGFHPLVVSNTEGKAAGEVRIVPNRPVVDIYTPSQASWGDLYFFNVAGANLSGVQVIPQSSAVQFTLLESQDGLLSGILEVQPGAGTVSTTVELRGAGGMTELPIELRDHSALTQKTSIAGKSITGTTTSGEVEGIWIQDPVQLLRSAAPKSFDWEITCRFSHRRGFSISGTRVLLKQLNQPAVQNVLQAFWKGETRRIQTLVTVFGLAVQVSVEITCVIDSQGLEHFSISFCFYFESYIETVGLGGQRVIAEGCIGTAPEHFTISGSGFWNFHYRWGAGGTKPNGDCVGTTDVSPQPFDGPRITDVTMNNCCEETATLDTDFKLGEDPAGTSRNFRREVGPFTPHEQFCPVFKVTITEPPDNPEPKDLEDNFTFLAEREFSAIENGTIITSKATLEPFGDPAQINWTVTPTIGTIRAVTPSTRKGPQLTFIPDAPDHPQYLQGTDCSSPGNGSCDRSEPLKYVIQAEYDGYVDKNTIVQDEIDIIRQEYRNHGITVPARSDFNAVTATANFTAAEINITPYRLVLGTPGHLAQTVRDVFNSKIHDDVQLVPYLTEGLPPTAQIVGPGDNVQEIGAVLSTRRCFPAPIGSCDDVVSGSFILAGPNGIAETRALNVQTHVPIRINSAWRNPQRNEAVHGALRSQHQFGDAVDLDLFGPAEGLTMAQLWCILQTAADDAGYNGFAENGPTQTSCTSAVSHVHVQN